MEYIEEIDDECRIIFARIKGEMTTESLAPFSTATRLRAKQLKYGIVFDYRQAHNRIGITDTFYWFTDHYGENRSELKRIPSAFLHKKEDHAFGVSAVTSLVNQGVLVRLFADEKSAIEWVAAMLDAPTAK